jgi:hypothetical protein
MTRLHGAWDALKITRIASNARPVMQRGDSLTVTARIELGALKPEEVLVELYHGTISNQGNTITNARRTEMKPIKDGAIEPADGGNGATVYFFTRQLEDLCASRLDGKPTPTTAEDGRETVKFIETMYRIGKKGD